MINNKYEKINADAMKNDDQVDTKTLISIYKTLKIMNKDRRKFLNEVRNVRTEQ